MRAKVYFYSCAQAMHALARTHGYKKSKKHVRAHNKNTKPYCQAVF